MSNYGWIITHDLIEFGLDRGTTGPRSIPDDILERLKKGDGKKFTLHDDDGELCYKGRYIGPEDESMFGPLDDFGMPNAGCTEIRYGGKVL